MNRAELKSPYVWFGGKAAVADTVWSRIGDVDNAVEPFMGSCAWMLRRPDWHRGNVETVNDKNHHLVNVWRAIRADPDAVADHADWIVSEVDLHARHRWLVYSETAKEVRERIAADPDYFDAKTAGWWLHGSACWIGSGWCENPEWEGRATALIGGERGVGHAVNSFRKGKRTGGQIDNLSAGSQGVQALGQIVDLAGGFGKGMGVVRRTVEQLPNMDPGRDGTAGVQRKGRPQLADAFDIGRGVNANGVLGTCDQRRAWLTDWMRRLSDRVRLWRICYQHWARVCDSPSTTERLGVTGVFLDPPYPTHKACGKKSRAKVYSTDGDDLNKLRDEVLAWCRKWGPNENVRIALCCYEQDGYEPLEREGWDVTAWTAQGGYGNRAGAKNENAKRERIYYSPHCVAEPDLFSGVA